MQQHLGRELETHSEAVLDVVEISQPRVLTAGIGRVAVLLLFAPVGGLLVSSSRIPLTTRVLATGFWALCLIPAILYLRTPSERRRPIPLLPFVGLLYGLYYPLSVVLGSANEYYKITIVPETDYAAPVLLGFLGWIFLLAGYLVCTAIGDRRIGSWREDWNVDVVKRWAVRLVFLGSAMEIVRFTVGVPVIIGGVATFVVSLAQLGIGLLVFLYLRTGLSVVHRVILSIGVAAALMAAVASGLMSEVLRLALILLFAVWVARQTLKLKWIWLATAGLCLLLVAKGVLLEFRRMAWYSGLSASAQVDMMHDLIDRELADKGAFGAVASGLEAVSIRSALTDLFADVMIRTPSQVPYWRGSTYLHLVGAFVPRFLWPEKPVHRIGNEFGHRYGYIDSFDMRTSWNLPVMIEFYVNFGEGAVLIGMFVVGVLYGLFCVFLNRPGQNPLISLAALVLAMMLINIESDFSLMFGAMVMQGAALWAVLAMIARDSRKANARRAAAALDEQARGELAPA